MEFMYKGSWAEVVFRDSCLKVVGIQVKGDSYYRIFSEEAANEIIKGPAKKNKKSCL